MMSVLRALGRAWMRFAHALGRIQTFLILSIVYLVVLGPIGVVMRLTGQDPLRRPAGEGRTGWDDRIPEPAGLPAARRMF